MQNVALLDTHEWECVRRLLTAARAFAKAADNGELKGALDTSSAPGKRLVALLLEIQRAADALPEGLADS